MKLQQQYSLYCLFTKRAELIRSNTDPITPLVLLSFLSQSDIEMASPLDMTKFTAKERNAAKKELLKKIDAYNKQMKKAKEPAFPLSTPSTVSLHYNSSQVNQYLHEFIFSALES